MAARAAAEEAQTWFLRFFRLAHLTPQRLLRACYSGLWKSMRAHEKESRTVCQSQRQHDGHKWKQTGNPIRAA